MRFIHTLLLALALGTTIAMVASGHGHDPGHSGAASAKDDAFGSPGKAKDATRVIDVSLLDTMRIEPGRLSVKQGETLRLRIRNAGTVAHEFVLGTAKEIDEHREMMRKMPTMAHQDANAVSVAPGATSELIWKFSKAGTFQYACLIPGHWEAGMQGIVTVSTATTRR